MQAEIFQMLMFLFSQSFFCRLRLAAKQLIEEGEILKAKTADSKAEVDLTSLQLQSLLYEKNYYNKEIASCRSFK